MTYKHLFGRFAAKARDAHRLHFAAHSHHWWPDVSLAAQTQAWDDAAELVDDKWPAIFSDVIPAFQAHVARTLNLPDPATIVVAPNTHEFVTRIQSCFDTDRPVRWLTTSSEFHSLGRQLARWIEAGRVQATIIDTEPFHTFAERFAAAASSPELDLIYCSQVFFDSGFVVPDLAALVSACHPNAVVLIDGYHGFCARPTDLASIAQRAFYMSGGYKYAMAGEGACFMHCPPGVLPRPVNTGWYAGFGELQRRKEGEVAHATDGSRFLGATFDPSGVYRFNAVQDMLVREGIEIATIHEHVVALQQRFLQGLSQLPNSVDGLTAEQLIPGVETAERGHFLTFRSDRGQELHRALAEQHVATDVRDDRLRLGFALYHDDADVDELLLRVSRLG
ncbi:MAG: kynureninase [Pseudohongiellaceae bacterium]|jgi:kynureninase